MQEEEETQQAQEALETALALVSNRQQRLTLLSDYTALLVRQEQWAKVLQPVKEALRLVPNDPSWLATQQQAQSQLSRTAPVLAPSWNKAHIVEQESISALKKTKEQWYDEGATLYNLMRYEEALITLDQAIRLDPNFALAYSGKGATLDGLKRYEEAIAAYDQAIRVDPNFALAYYNKGSALYQLGKRREAQQAYERATQLGYKG